MTDTYNLLKNELKVLNPDVTDKELNNAGLYFVNFFNLAVKILEEQQDIKDQLLSNNEKS